MEIKPAIKSVESFAVQPASIPVPGYLTPPQIATAYNIPANNGVETKVGIISLGGGYLTSDLNKSMTDLGLPTPTITPVPVNQPLGWTPTTNFSLNLNTYPNGTYVDPNGIASVENTLDLYCVASMIPAANISIYVSPNTLTDFKNCVDRAVSDNCDVITISWGIDEVYNVGDFLSTALANAVSKGISVFCSSGDFGAESDNQGTGVISAGYPASSPNVTGVGGTTLTLGAGNTRASELASSTSGGGISTIFSVPTWQNNLSYKTYPGNVTQTLTSGTLRSNPQIGRGVPDISAPMNGYAFYFNGNIIFVGGTSAGTPVMASMVARFISLNSGRRPPPGSLNTIFYSNSRSFYDLTTGNNAAPPTNTGYSVTPGWDAVTGLGSQANGVQTYQSVTGAGVRVNDGAGNWLPVKNVQIKTGKEQWSNAKAIWTNVGYKTWRRVY